MSKDQCINFLKAAIQDFRSELCPEERALLQAYYSKGNPNFRWRVKTHSKDTPLVPGVCL